MKWIAAILMVSALCAEDVCAPTPEVLQALLRLRIPEMSRANIREQIEVLMQKHPENFFVLERYEREFHFEKPERRQQLQKQFKQLLASHPQNPEFTILYAKSLLDTDTPQAIDLLKKTASHPQSQITLAEILSRGKFADRNQSLASVEAYFEACPSSINGRGLSVLQRLATGETAQKHIDRLRKIVASKKDLYLVEVWPQIWNMEFAVVPVKDHPVLRKKIVADLALLEGSGIPESVRLLQLYLNAYTKVNHPEKVQQLEQKILMHYPESSAATDIAWMSWVKENPWTEALRSEENKQKYYRALLIYANSRPPDQIDTKMHRFSAVANMDSASAEQVQSASDDLLTALRNHPDSFSMPPHHWNIARALIKHKISLDQIPALVQSGWRSLEKLDNLRSDRDPEDLSSSSADTKQFLKADAASIFVDAAIAMKNPAMAKDAVTELESIKMEKPSNMVPPWSALARFAEFENRKLDALVLYRTALNARQITPAGKDTLSEDVERLFKELGGSDLAWNLWKDQKTSKEEDGRWEKPTKKLTAWELEDLKGKTWRLTTLEGKTLLINVWATWCGPCRLEHPQLEKLYQQVKDRSDIQILTFNVDQEIGAVQPYMDENRYTFPVLLSREYVEQLIPALSIPRNWIIDAKGVWRDEQIGFDQDREWVTKMLQRIENIRTKK